MKRSQIAIATLGLLAILPLAANAADRPSYNYVEGGYVSTRRPPTFE